MSDRSLITSDATIRDQGVASHPSLLHEAPRALPERRAGRVWVRGLRQPGLLVSLLVLMVVSGWALRPSAFSSYGPLETSGPRLAAPSGQHWFGTDYLGRDLYARVIYGTRLSLASVVLAVAIAFLVGCAVGVLAGFAGGRVDGLLMRVVDVVLAIPGLLLALVIVTVIGSGTFKVAIAVGLVSVTMFARVMRSEVLRVRSTRYVEASRVLGRGWLSTLLRHVLPNSLGPVGSLIVLALAEAILTIAGLSFLGFGAQPPTPEWGALIAGGQDYLYAGWWLIGCPGAVVVAVVLAINRIARALRHDGDHTW
jgi:peptide/nickel transport system permease protein